MYDNDFEGVHEVEFANGEIRLIDVIQNVVDAYSRPIYLICSTGKIYNWMNIISVRKK